MSENQYSLKKIYESAFKLQTEDSQEDINKLFRQKMFSRNINDIKSLKDLYDSSKNDNDLLNQTTPAEIPGLGTFDLTPLQIGLIGCIDQYYFGDKQLASDLINVLKTKKELKSDETQIKSQIAASINENTDVNVDDQQKSSYNLKYVISFLNSCKEKNILNNDFTINMKNNIIFKEDIAYAGLGFLFECFLLKYLEENNYKINNSHLDTLADHKTIKCATDIFYVIFILKKMISKNNIFGNTRSKIEELYNKKVSMPNDLLDNIVSPDVKESLDFEFSSSGMPLDVIVKNKENIVSFFDLKTHNTKSAHVDKGLVSKSKSKVDNQIESAISEKNNKDFTIGRLNFNYSLSDDGIKVESYDCRFIYFNEQYLKYESKDSEKFVISNNNIPERFLTSEKNKNYLISNIDTKINSNFKKIFYESFINEGVNYIKKQKTESNMRYMFTGMRNNYYFNSIKEKASESNKQIFEIITEVLKAYLKKYAASIDEKKVKNIINIIKEYDSNYKIIDENLRNLNKFNAELVTKDIDLWKALTNLVEATCKNKVSDSALAGSTSAPQSTFASLLNKNQNKKFVTNLLENYLIACKDNSSNLNIVKKNYYFYSCYLTNIVVKFDKNYVNEDVCDIFLNKIRELIDADNFSITQFNAKLTRSFRISEGHINILKKVFESYLGDSNLKSKNKDNYYAVLESLYKKIIEFDKEYKNDKLINLLNNDDYYIDLKYQSIVNLLSRKSIKSYVINDKTFLLNEEKIKNIFTKIKNNNNIDNFGKDKVLKEMYKVILKKDVSFYDAWAIDFICNGLFKLAKNNNINHNTLRPILFPELKKSKKYSEIKKNALRILTTKFKNLGQNIDDDIKNEVLEKLQ